MIDATSRPLCRLIGTDGNIFALVGKASRALRREGFNTEAIELQENLFKMKSYDEALNLISDYVEIE